MGPLWKKRMLPSVFDVRRRVSYRATVPLLCLSFMVYVVQHISWSPTTDVGEWQSVNDEFRPVHKTTAVSHHAQLETHREQIALSSASSEELHEIMKRQLNITHGIYEGAPYKKILYWNDMGNYPISRENSNYGVGVGRDRYKLAGCPVWQCETSEDRTDLLQYDAIIFNQHRWNGSDLPNVRSLHQRYIFFSYESPVLGRLYETWDNYWATIQSIPFNWTMTYRWDSDIVHPFSYIEPKGAVPMHPTEKVYQRLLAERPAVNYAAKKTKMAAFFESNCNEVTSNRAELVAELRYYGVQIDHYGRCGNMTCALKESVLEREADEVENCLKMAGPIYKFFLAFDNSLCLDWMPERFTHAMRYSMIPIVMDVHGNHAKFAPPHSFINALDFPSARQLADYLKMLDHNDELYNEYFWWTPHYRIDGNIFEGINYKYFCSLCAALHDPTRAVQKVYNDIKQWWMTDAQCKTTNFDGMYASELEDY